MKFEDNADADYCLKNGWCSKEAVEILKRLKKIKVTKEWHHPRNTLEAIEMGIEIGVKTEREIWEEGLKKIQEMLKKEGKDI